MLRDFLRDADLRIDVLHRDRVDAARQRHRGGAGAPVDVDLDGVLLDRDRVPQDVERRPGRRPEQRSRGSHGGELLERELRPRRLLVRSTDEDRERLVADELAKGFGFLQSQLSSSLWIQ